MKEIKLDTIIVFIDNDGNLAKILPNQGTEHLNEEQALVRAIEEISKRIHSPVKASEQINEPSHYEVFPKVQAREIIKAALTFEEYNGFLKGNILKYRLRVGGKDDVEQELAKAGKYKAELYERTNKI